MLDDKEAKERGALARKAELRGGVSHLSEPDKARATSLGIIDGYINYVAETKGANYLTKDEKARLGQMKQAKDKTGGKAPHLP